MANHPLSDPRFHGELDCESLRQCAHNAVLSAQGWGAGSQSSFSLSEALSLAQEAAERALIMAGHMDRAYAQNRASNARAAREARQREESYRRRAGSR